MNILHYSLGLPPYRSGGLTKYSVDLILEQCSNGHNVSLLYPGGINIISKKTRIKQNPNFSGITVYEIINSTPVPLLYGIKDPNSILDESYIDVTDFECLLDKLGTEVFHIHTFMGLPKVFLNVLKKRKIKIVFTTHDYFGICPKVNLINERGCLCLGPSPERCAKCNVASPSPLYLRLRNLPMLSNLKPHKKAFPFLFVKSHTPSAQKVVRKTEVVFATDMFVKYGNLNEHYKQMYAMVDVFHFNSNQTRDIYNSYGIGINGNVISITHSGIEDNRKERIFAKDRFRFGFIGNTTPYKGFDLLKGVLMKLYNDGYKNWILDVYGGGTGVDEECNNIKFRGKFTSSDLERIYRGMDLLIVPSICYETFSLVALEALSYGTCVAVSKHVGAKDIVACYAEEFVFSDDKDLYSLIGSVLDDDSYLLNYQEKIRVSPWYFSMKEHCNEIVKLYKKILDV